MPAKSADLSSESAAAEPETTDAAAPADSSAPRTLSARAIKPKPAPKVIAPTLTAIEGDVRAGSNKGQNLQDQFLNMLRRNKTPVTMFLVKGVKLQGVVTWFDNFSILLRRDGHSQLVYKHAISTVMPGQPVDVSQFITAPEQTKKVRLLQDVFLASVRAAGVHVTMFLVNGVMLQGRVAAYDLFCMMLERDGYVQLAYKHAVSTIQPLTPVDLTGEWDGDEGEPV